jgi:predicted phage terminase large subunit-like protein
MALSNTERTRLRRARLKMEKDRAQSLGPSESDATQGTSEQIQARNAAHAENFKWATEFDATNKRYKSECRSLVDLLTIFEGTNPLDRDEDEEDGAKSGKKKKTNRAIPEVQKFKIRAIELMDNSLGEECAIRVPIEPDMYEYTTLKGDKVNPRIVYEVDGQQPVTFREWLDLRDRGRKDLFWLSRLLGRQLYHKSHQMICDMFVQKQFDDLYFPDFNQDDVHEMIRKQKRFAEDGTPTRTMLLMAPRSGYKSTIDGVDAVQWMLNAPDIRIMLITAFRPLAKTFLGEIKKYFYLPQRGQPTAFQMLYPEYVLTGVDGRSKEPIVCPAQTFNSKEPHLWITSMESSATGLRCDIRKADDAVDPKNSNSEELREKFAYDFAGTGDLVEPWGFSDVIGTRYFTKDWYGTRMSKDENGNEPAPYSFLCISAWYPKPQFVTLYEELLAEQDGMFKVTEDMVDLWFPQKLSFQALRQMLREKKERSFKNQQLNIATDPKEIDDFINHFDREVMVAHTFKSGEALPEFTEIIQCWDFAYSEKRTSDFSVGATIGIFKDKNEQYGLVVLDVIHDKWKSSELDSQMLAFYEKHKARVSKIYIEEANGAGFLMKNIANLAKLKGSDMMTKVRLRPVSNKPKAKILRAKDLEFLLGHERLWFCQGSWIEELYKQFSNYNGKKSTAFRKDDFIDAISFATEHLPATSLQHNPDPKDVEEEYEKRREKEIRDGWYRRMHDGIDMGVVTTAKAFQDRFNNRPPPPPPVLVEEPVDPRQELMKKIVGKILPIGMRI